MRWVHVVAYHRQDPVQAQPSFAHHCRKLWVLVRSVPTVLPELREQLERSDTVVDLDLGGAGIGAPVRAAEAERELARLPGLDADGVWKTVGLAALLGFVAYGTYDFTNYATLKDWPLHIVVIDVIWGMSVTTMTALIGYYAGTKLLN